MNYYRHIDRTQVQFDFLHSDPDCIAPELQQEIKRLGGKDILIPFGKIKSFFKAWKMAYLFLKQHASEYDILHVHQMGPGFSYLFLGWLFNIKVRIIHSHSTCYSPKKSRAIRNALYILPFRPFATDIWACSNAAGKFLFGKRKWKKQGVYIPNAIAIDEFKFSPDERIKKRQELSINDKTLTVIHTGEISHAKNPLFLLRIFYEIHKKNPDSILISCGKITLKNAIEQEIKNLDLEKYVKLLGPRSDVKELLSAADCMVFPSRFEGLPISVLEAQLTSLPVVVSKAVPEDVAVSDNIQFLSLKDKPEKWADTILGMVSTTMRKTGTVSNAKVNHFNIVTEAVNLSGKYISLLPEKKRFVIPNSLSFTCDTPSNCENKRIIALGRFSPEKGFDYLLQTAVKLKSEIPDWHIDIFGNGEDETMLKELAKKLQVDDFVTFNPPTKEVIKELCNSGMYVMSSRYEGFGLVLTEAQECGLPIVSFDCPEGPSGVIRDGEDGFLVPLADTDALAEKIITLAKNEEMRKEFGRNAKINCKQFSPERVGEMWMDLINKLTADKENKK